MSNLSELIDSISATDPEKGRALRKEFQGLTERSSLGLYWENHNPESILNYGRVVRVGDIVGVLPERGSKIVLDQRYRVTRITGKRDSRMVELVPEMGAASVTTVPMEDVVVFNDADMPIYPGLKETGNVLGGNDHSPTHSVITAENYDALRMMQFTHHGTFDAIYIDPPYNTGAKDWKYNNDYVSTTDKFKSSKWLSMMEARLKLAKNLMNPEKSVMIVSIDEREYLNLGILLRQVFPEARIQMVSSVISRKGTPRKSMFSRTDEYVYFVHFGDTKALPLELDNEWTISGDGGGTANALTWILLRRTGSGRKRENSPGCFYPIFIKNTEEGPVFSRIGDTFYGDDFDSVDKQDDEYVIWPIAPKGYQGRWSVVPEKMRAIVEGGFAKLGKFNGEKTSIYYMTIGEINKVKNGEANIVGYRHDGSVIEDGVSARKFVPGTQWNIPSHDATTHGTRMLTSLLPDRSFPYPKSLYAVEDALRFFVADNPNAKILDFFGGSGTTLHAVMRLNAEDGGNRQCILVSNNEVSDDEAKKLTQDNLRPGDVDWEKYGICDYITKPRIKAAVTGVSTTGETVEGNYKYNHQFPISDGFQENVRFFTLSYESLHLVEVGYVQDRFNNILWLYSGGVGPVLDPTQHGYAVSSHYGVLSSGDCVIRFIDDVEKHDPNILVVNVESQSVFTTVSEKFPDKIVVNALRDYIRVFDREWN